MKNKETWVPSKFIKKKGKLRASQDKSEVFVGSRLATDIIAEIYEQHLKKHAQGRLLDLGCGKVPFFESYKEFVVDNTCADWGNTLHKNGYLDYEVDLTKKLPFDDDQFDTILLSDVLEHIPVPDQLWDEMARILNANGKIILNIPFYYWLHEKPYDYYRYTEFALRRFVENSGLKLVFLISTGGAPEIISDVIAKTSFQIPLIGSGFSSIFQRAAYIFIRSRIGKKISNRTKDNFPFGYFLVAQKI